MLLCSVADPEVVYRLLIQEPLQALSSLGIKGPVDTQEVILFMNHLLARWTSAAQHLVSPHFPRDSKDFLVSPLIVSAAPGF